MGRRVNTFDYLPRSIKNADTDNDMLKFMLALDTAFDDLADTTLTTAWDIENAPRDELFTMANSLGLFPQNFMDDDVLRRYIRSSGRIRELKGTDGLITYLVDSLTKFRVDSIELDGINNLLVDARLYYATTIDFEYQQRLLDFLISKYSKLIYSYQVIYIYIIEAIWANILNIDKDITVVACTDYIFNFEPMVFGTPFNMLPMDSYNREDIVTINSSEVIFVNSNNQYTGTVDEDITASIIDNHEVDVTPSWTSTPSLSVTMTEEVELAPTVTDNGTTAENVTTYPSITGNPVNTAYFYTPFQLVTLH